MRSLFVTAAIFLLFSSLQQAFTIPLLSSKATPVTALKNVKHVKVYADISAFVKRKGGGGSRGGGSGGGTRGGSSPSSGNSGATRSPPSSARGGGSTVMRPRYGGYYGGGAKTPYVAGRRSPLGVAPIFLGVALLSAYPGRWVYGAYQYPYSYPYSFYNRTGNHTPTDDAKPVTRRASLGLPFIPSLWHRQVDRMGVNQTKPVFCLCAPYSVCGCDDKNTTFLDSIIGDGTYANLNHSLVDVATVNGTDSIFLNGTLPNGTLTAEVNGKHKNHSVGRRFLFCSFIMMTVLLLL